MARLAAYRMLLVVLFGALLTASATAQEQQKIGYVDTDYILSQMSEYEGVQQQLRSLSADWNTRLEEMEEEIERLREDFEAREILYTDELKAKKQEQIQSLVEKRQQFLDEKFGAKGEYFAKQRDLLEPIQRKVFNAINAVAKRQNFDFVFDRARDSGMLFGTQKWNLNQQVLQELGVTLNDTSN